MRMLLGFCLMLLVSNVFAQPKVKIGSKLFTESYVLAEIFSQVLERQGYEVERKFGLGATGISFASLKASEVDLVPEYTGTISQAILKKELNTVNEINNELKSMNLLISKSLGFNNTYAFGALKPIIDKFNLSKLSDLKKYPQLKYAMTHEFLERKDGLKSLEKHYQMKITNISSIDHNLSYQALETFKVDVLNIYSTDAKIKKLGIIVLEDDLNFFPKYDAVIFANRSWVNKNKKAWLELIKIQNSISEEKMISLNAMVDIDKKSFKETANTFLNEFYSENNKISKTSRFDLVQLTKEHLYLVFISLFASILLAIPLGVLSSYNEGMGQFTLTITGLLQTIPSLALLCFLIPWLGIGEPPALMALFLYGLLPIVRNTYVGLKQIDSKIIESAKSLGLTPWQLLCKIRLPLASPSIMAGVKTSAIINVGTATLASFIGAGGYGTPIVTGLALNDTNIMLYGAIPAAILAVVLHFLFEQIDKIIIPKGLRS